MVSNTVINNYVLGINFLHSDTSACIFKNSELIAATEEERYTRVKHTSSFPYNSIKYCLNDAGINISEVDIITINSNPFASFLNKIFWQSPNISFVWSTAFAYVTWTGLIDIIYDKIMPGMDN